MHSIIKGGNYLIEFSSILDSGFENLLKKDYSKSRKVILVDENTHEYCLEYLILNFKELAEAEIILLPEGEENKVMEVCFQVWEAMSQYQISRKDLIINLGGGMVCDIGGFIASIFKRGIDFINIPTTLLAMVDASIGGKTGINLGNYKNQLGVIANPKAVYIDFLFLHTLPKLEIQNGFAEMLKHALIKDKNHWKELRHKNPSTITLEDITRSVSIKHQIVKEDPQEENKRKKLNFGHTFGHAFEGFFLYSKNKVKHGHAVALGILCESYLSYKRGKINLKILDEIQKIVVNNYSLIKIAKKDFGEIVNLMYQDKKNRENKILCVLLNDIGSCSFDQEINQDEIFEVLDWYNKIKK